MKRILRPVALGTIAVFMSGCVAVELKQVPGGYSMRAESFLSTIGNASASFNTNTPGTGTFTVNSLTGDQQTIAQLAQVAIALAPLALANKAPTNSVTPVK